jgi:hypothetical protein
MFAGLNFALLLFSSYIERYNRMDIEEDLSVDTSCGYHGECSCIHCSLDQLKCYEVKFADVERKIEETGCKIEGVVCQLKILQEMVTFASILLIMSVISGRG